MAASAGATKKAIELLSSSFLHVDLPSTIIVEASIATPTTKNNHRSAIHQALIVPENDCFFAIQAINVKWIQRNLKEFGRVNYTPVKISELLTKWGSRGPRPLRGARGRAPGGGLAGKSEQLVDVIILATHPSTSRDLSHGYQKMLKSLVSKASSTHKNFQLSPFNQQEATTSLLIAIGEDMHLFNQLLNYNFQTLDYIKGCIFQMCTGFFLCKLSMETRFSGDNKLFLFAFQDLIATIGSKYQQKIQDWPPPFKNSKGRNNPEVALPMLDAILKSSLERLKLMRLDLQLYLPK
ncbi:hypothetical protein R6Q59_007170 [Mikania micrantha]